MISIIDLWTRDNGICWLCKKFIPFESGEASRDHLVPRYAGGNHSMFNLSVAHARCNSSRDHRDFEEKWPSFLEEMERLNKMKESMAPIHRILRDPYKRDKLRRWNDEKRRERQRKMQDIFLRKINPNFRYRYGSLKEALRSAERIRGGQLDHKTIREIRKEFMNERSSAEKLRAAKLNKVGRASQKSERYQKRLEEARKKLGRKN